MTASMCSPFAAWPAEKILTKSYSITYLCPRTALLMSLATAGSELHLSWLTSAVAQALLVVVPRVRGTCTYCGDDPSPHQAAAIGRIASLYDAAPYVLSVAGMLKRARMSALKRRWLKNWAIILRSCCRKLLGSWYLTSVLSIPTSSDCFARPSKKR